MFARWHLFPIAFVWANRNKKDRGIGLKGRIVSRKKMRKKRKKITKERDNGKREVGNRKREREDYSGHERREIKEHRRTEKHRNVKTGEQTNKGTEEQQVNREETGEHEKWEWGKCGAKYTTRKKTVRSFTRQREDPSSRLKILAKMLQNGVHHVQ